MWVYFYTKEPQSKYETLDKLIHANIQLILLSLQVLGELFNVLTKKKLFTKSDTQRIVQSAMRTFPVVGTDESDVTKAIDVSIQYHYFYWDSLIIATAVQNNCKTLYSEDMQHSQLIESKTLIVNPFR